MSSRVPSLTAFGNRMLGRAILPQQRMRASQFEALPRPAADVVFLGDSITEYGLWNEWFPRLAVVNRGIAGDTSGGVLQRMHTAVGTQRVVSLLIGTNDLAIGVTPEKIAENVAAIIARITAGNETRVVLNSVMPRARSYRRPVRELNTVLSRVAADSGVTFLDLWPALAGPDGAIRSEFSGDRLHLTGAGYRAWLERLRPHIEAAE
ncbi:GDSL-type esterase/lipase family protein [Gryllotalpicola reticulitermitis]|uniref:GDSL-type esterase/lipase family protein n=1 Tax=Gryllotalpicola reticulitermitis TaxID=1184153 RepID=A0ABV8Q669_9MICO